MMYTQSLSHTDVATKGTLSKLLNATPPPPHHNSSISPLKSNGCIFFIMTLTCTNAQGQDIIQVTSNLVSNLSAINFLLQDMA